MPLAVGIAFQPAGRPYSYDPDGHPLQADDPVLAEFGRGVELGWVRHLPGEQTLSPGSEPLPRIVRRASPGDLRTAAENEARAVRALELSRERIAVRRLPMRLVRAAYQFDRTQLTLNFVAEGRVDFRELVKDLAAVLKTRIQLHQVGARDAAKLLGGIGPCGRALCCSTWLTEFEPVTMRMAKEQSLFLNPTKFSGVCGKLMCCLRYEYDHYRGARARLPAAGAEVQTPDGSGRVTNVNVVKETVLVALKGGSEREYPADRVERPVVRGCAVLAGGACSGGCGPRHP